jgi:hypothetical protein
MHCNSRINSIILPIGEVIKMSNRTQIERAILRAEESFQDCWSKLMIVRDGKDRPQLLNALVSFQPTLGLALYKLESEYVAVCREARELLRRQSAANKKWLHRRIHTLNGYKHLLKQAMDVGRNLGDAFAWLFYKDQYELLQKHYDEAPVPHMATGIGGRGEIEFVRRLPKLGRHLVLAHSTTTFLRIGDLSLIDPEDFSVAAIGELKTRDEGNGKLAITLVLIGPNPKRVELPPLQTNVPAIENPQKESLPGPLQDRLKRQVEKMQNSFKPHRKDRMLPSLGTESMVSICSKVGELFRRSSDRVWGQNQADRGLVLVGIKRRGDSLYKRLVSQSAAINNHNLAQTAEATRKIVDRSRADNSVHIGWLVYTGRERYRLARGMQAVFWWPLARGVAEALVFKRFSVMTVYNPAFLISDLRHSGLEVAADKNGEVQVWKQLGEKRYEVRGMGYFLALAREHLVSDKVVASVIAKFVEAVQIAGFNSSACVNMDIRFTYD